MASALLSEDPNRTHGAQCPTLAPHAVVVLVASMVAAWVAAGSTGLLAHPFQHALTWLALAVAIVAAWPDKNSSAASWAILAGSALIGLFLTASTLPTVNILAVVVVLAAIAQVSRGLTGRVALIAALAAQILAISRFTCDSIPTVWLLADVKGWMLGRLAGWLVGNPLEVGATFAGLDFLVLMAAIYVGWLVCIAPPRRPRAIWAVVAIVAGHFVYLIVLAHSEKLLAALPDLVYPPESDTSRLGLWTWMNGLRMLIPWNVPLLAVLINSIIAAVIFRGATWLPVIEPDPKELKKQKQKEEEEDIPGSVLMADMLFRFGPVLLAVFATLLVALGMGQSDLKGKTVVAYEKGYLNWLKPEYDSRVEGFYGMLPVFVESLGGKFVKSRSLSEQDLASADVLILIHPDEPWKNDMLDRVWSYVRRGGSLLVVADPVIREGKSLSRFNDVLRPLAMQVRNDTAVTRTGNWEQSYQVLAHPATAGIDSRRNRFGFELGSSIRTCWPALPVLVGRWGWSDPGNDAVSTGVSHYNAGELLGDLVLAAEQPFGQGRVVILGGTSPLRNEMLANSYPFVGRLLSYLANNASSPQALWRQLLGLTAVLAMAALLVFRPAAWQLILTPTVMAISLVSCMSASYWSGRVLPDGRAHGSDGVNNVAYIDASHLEAYNSDLWTDHGIAGLLRTLMRQGYLPLLAPDLTTERLERAALLISIAPARQFSPKETEAIEDFIGGGGTFICMVGAEEARPSAPLLANFDFHVSPSPVPPREDIREPEPLGAFRQLFGNVSNNRYVQFYAAWPVECVSANADKLVVWSDGKIERPVVVSHRDRGGTIVVIGDTRFASNENLETNENTIPDNIRFWRWLLSHVMPGQKPWEPPPAARDAKSAKGDAADTEEDERSEQNDKKGK